MNLQSQKTKHTPTPQPLPPPRPHTHTHPNPKLIQNVTEDTSKLREFLCVCHSFSFEDKDVSVLGGGGARGKLIFVLPFCFHTWLSETCGVRDACFLQASPRVWGWGWGWVPSRPVVPLPHSPTN